MARRPTWAPVAPSPTPTEAWRFQQNLALQRQQQEIKRQDELRRLREMRRGRPQVTNIYYQTPAPVAPAAPAVVTAPTPPTVVIPPSMPEPQPDVSPASPQADMGPTQDAAAPAAEEEHPGHKWGRRIIIGVAIAGAAYGGYRLYKHHKAKGHGGGSHSAHAVHGFGRARRRRR